MAMSTLLVDAADEDDRRHDHHGLVGVRRFHVGIIRIVEVI